MPKGGKKKFPNTFGRFYSREQCTQRALRKIDMLAWIFDLREGKVRIIIELACKITERTCESRRPFEASCLWFRKRRSYY